MAQGANRVFLGDKEYEYNSDNYRTLTVPLPTECETFACETEPLLAVLKKIYGNYP